MSKKALTQDPNESIKIIALGDIHGRSFWRQIVNDQVFDKLILIGDYFDSKEDISAENQMENFEAICNYKRTHPDEMILLIGNHDFHYLNIKNEKYSGYQPDYAKAISALLNRSIKEELLQMSFLDKTILFTHAGVTKTWGRENDINIPDIQNDITQLFTNHPERFGYLQSTRRVEHQVPDGISPIWVRPEHLIPDKIDGYIQVVGHTMQQRLTIVDNLYFIDSLGTSK